MHINRNNYNKSQQKHPKLPQIATLKERYQQTLFQGKMIKFNISECNFGSPPPVFDSTLPLHVVLSVFHRLEGPQKYHWTAWAKVLWQNVTVLTVLVVISDPLCITKNFNWLNGNRIDLSCVGLKKEHSYWKE